MTVMIEPGLLAGAVTPPPSKSQAHRLLIARALAGENLDDPAHRADSQDIRATRDCLKSLREGEGKLPVLECGESGLFKLPVHDPLNVFPDSVAVWTQDHKSLHAGIVDQLRLLADVRIPLGEIVLHTGDLFHFFVLCHDSSLNFIPELEANSLL